MNTKKIIKIMTGIKKGINFLHDTAANDAFGRFRVSNPRTLFDSKQIFNNQPLFWDDQEVSGSGTSSAHSRLTASSIMGVSNATAGKRVRQTFHHFNYQSGKSMLILMTGTCQTEGETGIIRSLGYFNDLNGLFFKDDNGVLSVVVRSNATGSCIDNAVPQSEWNLDKLDGTGTSLVELDVTKTQIYIIDFEWLGSGRQRFGFVIGGVVIYVHEFLHANVLAGVYMSTPNLPVRYEIENTGSGGAASLEHICVTVMSEGGVTNLGVIRSYHSDPVTNLSSGTLYASIGIRLKSTDIGEDILIESISFISTTQNDQVEWILIMNPTVTGVFEYNDIPNSSVQIAEGVIANIVTNGLEVAGGYFTTALPLTHLVENALRLGSAIDGTLDTYVLVVRPISNNITVRSQLTWREAS